MPFSHDWKWRTHTCPYTLSHTNIESCTAEDHGKRPAVWLQPWPLIWGGGGGQTDLSELQPEPSMRAHTHPHTHHQVAKNMLLGSTNVTGDSQIPTGCCVKRERKQQGARRERERHVSEGPGGSADRMRREESRDRCGDKELLKKMCQTHFYAIKRLKRFCFICDIIVFFLCFSAWVFHCVSVNEQRVCANPFAFESLC